MPSNLSASASSCRRAPLKKGESLAFKSATGGVQIMEGGPKLLSLNFIRKVFDLKGFCLKSAPNEDV